MKLLSKTSVSGPAPVRPPCVFGRCVSGNALASVKRSGLSNKLGGSDFLLKVILRTDKVIHDIVAAGGRVVAHVKLQRLVGIDIIIAA